MKTRMEHILEIVKELCKNEELVVASHNMEFIAERLVNTAYFIYDKIEDREEKIRIESRIGF